MKALDSFTPRAGFYFGEMVPGINWIVGWVGSGAGLGIVEKKDLLP
jgi:hypothetical protein